MNKRIRKKHRVGEFQELGFELAFTLDDSVSSSDADAFMDTFVKEAIAHNDLAFFGWGERSVEGTVITRARGSVTSEQRAAVDGWLGSRKEIASHRLGELADAWHG